MKNYFKINCKKIVAFILVLIMFCAFSVPISAQENLKLNYESAELYVLDDSYREAIGDIPAQYPRSVQLEVNSDSDSVYWYVSKGNSVTVDENGLVTPRTETWYWYGNVGTTAPPADGEEPTEIEVRYTTGESTVVCVVDGVSVGAVINVVDYSDVYVDEKIQEYIDDNITDSMTDYEKLDKVCRYVANFDYSVYYSGYKTMVIFGGGDCWASATLITYMCNNFLNLDAAVRYGVNDPGAGSGHRNAVVCIDGKYYEAEAGFAESAPRYYSISELEDGFSFAYSREGYKVYQYDGRESEVVIPGRHNNSPVTEIGTAVFYYNNWQDFAPVSVTIPDSVKVIDNFAFSGIDSIRNFYVDDNNEMYTNIDGVIYSKDKKTLFACPAGREGILTVPEGTECIGAYSVSYTSNITQVIIPEGVTRIEEGAFGDSEKLSSVVLPESLDRIENFAFYNDRNLSEIYIPEGVTYMGDNVFSNTEAITIFGEKGSYAQDYALSKGIKFVAILDGDANQDGKIDIKDATAIQKYLAEIIEFSAVQEDVADFNHSGKVTISDVTAIQKMLAGLEY